jgi:peptidyl-prolyl cis-trans isomerase SurA
MPDTLPPTNRGRPIAAVVALGIGLALVAYGPARAQTVAVFVNGEPITVHDIDQRMKLIELSTRKVPPRQEALDELVNEKLKLQVGKRYGLEVPDKDVDASFGTMARRANQTSKQFTEALSKAGINIPALKQRIKADITWSSIVRGKFPSINAIGERDVTSALETRKNDNKDTVAYQYTLRPLLFIVPSGSPPTAFEA